MRDIKDYIGSEKISINCKTLEETQLIALLLVENGGRNLSEEAWGSYKNKLTFRLDDVRKGYNSYSDINYDKSKNIEILQASEFLQKIEPNYSVFN